jgi:photosystem II stability/assembly factor-like uncharacterized protein
MPPEGKLRVYRSTNGGESWTALSKGLPQGNSYDVVLRHALTVDALDPAGVYFGTTAGTLYGSRDAGESWHALPLIAPRIVCLAASVE